MHAVHGARTSPLSIRPSLADSLFSFVSLCCVSRRPLKRRRLRNFAPSPAQGRHHTEGVHAMGPFFSTLLLIIICLCWIVCCALSDPPLCLSASHCSPSLPSPFSDSEKTAADALAANGYNLERALDGTHTRQRRDQTMPVSLVVMRPILSLTLSRLRVACFFQTFTTTVKSILAPPPHPPPPHPPASTRRS